MKRDEFSDDHRPFDPIDRFRSCSRPGDAAAPQALTQGLPLSGSDGFFDNAASLDNALFFDDDFVPGNGGQLRMGMEEMLASIAAGRYDRVVVWELPRALRNEMKLVESWPRAKERTGDRAEGPGAASPSAENDAS